MRCRSRGKVGCQAQGARHGCRWCISRPFLTHPSPASRCTDVRPARGQPRAATQRPLLPTHPRVHHSWWVLSKGAPEVLQTLLAAVPKHYERCYKVHSMRLCVGCCRGCGRRDGVTGNEGLLCSGRPPAAVCVEGTPTDPPQQPVPLLPAALCLRGRPCAGAGLQAAALGPHALRAAPHGARHRRERADVCRWGAGWRPVCTRASCPCARAPYAGSVASKRGLVLCCSPQALPSSARPSRRTASPRCACCASRATSWS